MAGEHPIRIRYRRRTIEVRPGESLSSALLRQGVGIQQRSIRYHRPRGPFCGKGHCTGCLARVNGVPNVRACRYSPRDGDRIATENAWPSPSFDAYGAFDRLYPRGIDTLHGFRRPAFATRLFQRFIRRLAGFGTLADPSAPSDLTPGARIDTETIVIGAGSAGRAFAARFGPAAGGTVVVERERAAEPIPGARLLDRTAAIFLPPPSGPREKPFRLLAVRADGAGIELRARRMVIASGGYDASLLFRGNDRPGVFTAEGAIALASPPDRPPFRSGILVGGGPRAAELLERWGGAFEAIVAPGIVGPRVVRKASELGVPIYPKSLILRAVGLRHVRGLRIAPRGGGRNFTIEGDAIVLAYRRLPNPQLYFQCGARMEWRAETGAYYPVLYEGFVTSVPDLYAVGESAGFVEAAAPESARRLADRLLEVPGATNLFPEMVAAGGLNELQGYYYELMARAPRRGKTIVCPCEDVLLEELWVASSRGFRGIEVMKRYTGIGSGLCQGRYCLPDALLLLSIWEGRSPAEVGYITQRPPVEPVRLGALAGLPTAPEVP